MKPKILLVEDERNVGSTLMECLAKEGYEICWSTNGGDARLEISGQKFDLAILDVGLPDDSGFEVAKKIRQTSKQTSIIFLTAFGNPEDRIYGLELGAEDYIIKPFHLKEFLLRVKNVLKRARTLIQKEDFPSPIGIGKASVHFGRFEAEVDGTPFALTHKEWALLKLLLLNKKNVLSRDQILDEIWSKDEFPSSRTVDNFIMRLRRLVEIDPENPRIIQSVRGVGYRLS